MSKTEAQKARIKRWNSSEGAKQARKRYLEKNKEKRNAYQRKWQRNLTPEQHKKKLAAQARWREKNREHAAAHMRERYWAERTPRRLDHQLKWHLCENAMFAAINKAVSRSLPDYIRDDVIQDMIVAVLEARLAVEDIGRRASEFVKDHFRRFSLYEFKSLDIEDAAVRMERIPATVEMWEQRA